MDFTTNKLILAGYLILALLVGVIGFAFVRSQRDMAMPAQATTRPQAARQVISGSNSTALSKQLRIDIRRQRERITELQNLLAKREEILKQQAAQIETQTTESKRLQDEADRYLQLLTEVAQESVESIDENLDLLESGDAAAEALLDSREPPSREVLEAALQAAQWELDMTQAAANESAAALAEQTQRMLLMRQAIVDTGEAAIPFLVSMLSGNDRELRIWSASALARVASRSSIAIDSLLIAAEDPDVEVRTAAQAAIQELSGN